MSDTTDRNCRGLKRRCRPGVRLIAWFAILSLVLAIHPRALWAGDAQARGLPFIRTYPLDEIGSVPRGLRLGFDSFNRFAVMYDGIYSVLNDSVWVNQIDPDAADRTLMTTIRVSDGNYFYGGRGSWGTVERTKEGRFHPHPLVPPDAPAWTKVTPFNELLITPTGVYFYELNGVVYWDFNQRRNFFFELPRVSSVFSLQERVFVSCQDQVLREIHPGSQSVETVTIPGLENTLVERSTALDRNHLLLALQDGRLVIFDGHTIAPWPPQTRYRFNGGISALTSLVDEGVALATQSDGLFLIASDGSLRWHLPLPDFRRIRSIAANEAGVLWVLGENAIHKIFYNSPLTGFDQQLGLTAAWPNVASLNERVLVCSNMTLYELEFADPGSPCHFRPATRAPEGGVACLATHGSQLVVGNATGVYAAIGDGEFTPLIRIENVASVEFLQSDLCIVIGSREIAALRYRDGRWTECAPRIPGVGDAPVHSVVRGSIWIEMGGDQVGKISYRDDRLFFERLPLPWTGAQWTNVGAVGNTIVLSGNRGQRAYYDETRGTFLASPELDRIFNRSPYWITRMTEDAVGTIWATHMQGVVTLTPKNGDYVVDATTFELHNDSYPMIKLLSSGIWVTSGRSLHHIEKDPPGPLNRPQAVLVSLMVDHLNRELLLQKSHPELPLNLAFEDNGLSFRFFSGTYAWRYPPPYEYRLGDTESWTRVDPGLLIRFPKLQDAKYRLEVRPAAPEIGKSTPLAFEFLINPPWYRTAKAYAAYSAILILLIIAVVRQSNHRTRQRNETLEHIVRERTTELEVAMKKLNEETRNSATMAERSRLAGEIHDSLQQGLSGSIMQLDTTLSTAPISPSLRSRLNIVRSMLSYTREEIQHSVLNLESPLLQNSNLGDALKKLSDFIGSGSIRMNVVVPTQLISLEPAAQHHLLRIAQEAITNSVKHARARCIDVSLHADVHSVVLTVRDDGDGFDPTLPVTSESHFGLRGMKNRARAMKAQLDVQSSPGNGTTIKITVPIPTLYSHDNHSQIKPT